MESCIVLQLFGMSEWIDIEEINIYLSEDNHIRKCLSTHDLKTSAID